MQKSDLPLGRQWLWDLSDEQVLICTVAAESLGEPIAGKLGVAQVIVNRTKRSNSALIPWFAKTIKQNCLMKHQFTCYWQDYLICEKIIREAAKPINPHTRDAILQCHYASVAAMAGKEGDRTFGADHYFNPKTVKVWPKWAYVYKFTVQIKNHLYFDSTKSFEPFELNGRIISR